MYFEITTFKLFFLNYRRGELIDLCSKSVFSFLGFIGVSALVDKFGLGRNRLFLDYTH